MPTKYEIIQDELNRRIEKLWHNRRYCSIFALNSYIGIDITIPPLCLILLYSIQEEKQYEQKCKSGF